MSPRTTFNHFMSVLLVGLLLSSCSVKNKEHEADLVAGNWGELRSLNERLPSRTFLIDIKQYDTFSVCYESSLAAKWPDFEAELEIALAHWGRYIGAEIKISAYPVKLPKEGKKLSAGAALNFYKEKSCPKADLIVAEHDIEGALGQVLENYSYHTVDGKQKIASFNKGLFIKSESKELRWISLREAFGPEILRETHTKLLARNLFYARKNAHENLLFTTLLHEAGHVWGLCDQYKLADGSTNCHPEYSNSILEDDSIMSSSGTILTVFLRNDDVEGIENLAKRRRPSWTPISYTPEAAHPDYIFSGATLKYGKLQINVNIHKGAKLTGELTIKGFDDAGEFTTLSSQIELAKASSDLFQTIEFDLGRKFQLTSLSFAPEEDGDEIEIQVDP